MVISKQDAAKHLRQQGYDAEVSNDGVVVVYLGDDEMKGAVLRRIRKQLENVGYTASWGVKPGRDAK